MNRDTRMWIVIAIAVLTAGAASSGMYWVISTQPGVVEPPRLLVVVAKKDLEMGTTVAEADLKIVKWPADGQIVGAFASFDEVKDKALIAPVLANEPITKSKLAEGGYGFTPKIDKGFRAVSVKVNEVIGVAGFVTPGTRVDVLVTMRQDKDSKARVVVQNVVVLTAGTKYDDPEGRKQGKPIPTSVVTLMVSPEDSERIAVASSQGQIMLALRNPMDKAVAKTFGVTGEQLMAGGDQQAVLPPPPPPRDQNQVRVVSTARDPLPRQQQPCQVETFKAGKREVLPCT